MDLLRRSIGVDGISCGQATTVRNERDCTRSATSPNVQRQASRYEEPGTADELVDGINDPNPYVLGMDLPASNRR
jgi:hypothetical protein